MKEMSVVEARNEALAEILRQDERAFIIGRFGGPFEPPNTLAQEFGVRGQRDVPISETGYGGAAIGAAMAGLRPIVTFATGSFIFNAWEQVVNEAANMRYMSAGQVKVPVVIHIQAGIRGQGATQHSHTPQGMLMNTPGLKLILPSTPADMKGLLKAAAADDNPVVLCDHLKLHPFRGPVPEGDYTIPLGKGEVKRPGSDVTIVATSLMVQRSLAAAETLAREGIQAEVVDPRTLVPLDKQIILDSVAKTGRVVVVDECHRSCGVAAELAAVIAEEGFSHLKAPILRVTTLDVPVPYSAPLEDFIVPDEAKIVEAVKRVLALAP